VTDALREWGHPLAIALVGALAMFGIGFRHEKARAAATPANELRVPHTEAPIAIDGEGDERDWTRAPARTGAFFGPDGTPARPVSEARVLWDETNLYFSLYAADEEIRVAKVAPDGPVWTGDFFSVELTNPDGTAHTIYVAPSGTLTDATSTPGHPLDYLWQSGAKVAMDVDGTLDDPRDRDEEWVVEMATPFERLGIVPRRGARIGIALRRCDVQERRRTCGTWSGVLVLE
jgi:hypothetical protein